MTDCCGQHNLIITYKSVFPCQGNTLRSEMERGPGKERNMDTFSHSAPLISSLDLSVLLPLTPLIMQSWVINIHWCLGKKPPKLKRRLIKRQRPLKKKKKKKKTQRKPYIYTHSTTTFFISGKIQQVRF